MAAEPFFTTCTTCTSRLKVRDESAIGQILACPKCGSMVLVEPPEGMEGPAADVIEEPAESEDGVSPESGLSPEDWRATNPGAKTGWLTVGVGSLAVVAIVGSIATFGWMRWQERQRVASSQRPNDPASAQVAEPDGVIASDSTSELTASSEADPGEGDTNSVPGPAPQDVVLEEPPAAVADDVSVEEIFAETNGVEELDSDVVAAASGFVQQVTPDLSASAKQGTQPNSESPSLSLNGIARLLGGPAELPRDETGNPDPELPPTDDGPTTTFDATHAAYSNGNADAGTAAQLDAKSLLNHHVRAVRFDRVPLARFLHSMMELSGVPIQVAPEALVISPGLMDSQVSVSLVDQPVLEILRRALKPRKLVPIVMNDVVVIDGSSTDATALLSTSHFVGDLVRQRDRGNGEELDLATLISTLVEPESWASLGGGGTIELKGDKLMLTNTRLATVRTVVLLEKLRVARTLKPPTKAS